MQIQQINFLLSEVREKLESLDLESLSEMNTHPSQHHGEKMSAARTRLQQLYAKLTAGRTDTTRIKATGAKR